ncbi:hypothetical protein [Aquitalea pelogenes]|uniref:hypothetical protein n=1 Tax=Aquitalea pelogenes TaxID=1293573 RepID=UPI0035AF50FE
MSKKSFKEEARKINYVEAFVYAAKHPWLKKFAERIQREFTDENGKCFGEEVVILNTQFAYFMKNELEDEHFNPEKEFLMFTDREAVIIDEVAQAIKVRFTLDRKTGFIYKQRNLALYLDEQPGANNPFITIEDNIRWANVAIISKESLMNKKKNKTVRVSPLLVRLITKNN